MSATTKLTAFAVALAAVFAVAYGIGRVTGDGEPDRTSDGHEQPAPDRDGTGHDAAQSGGGEPKHGGESQHGSKDTVPVRGLGATDDSTALRLASRHFEPKRRQALDFRIEDLEGQTIRRFRLGHERRMHVIVARRDLTRFQHLHPRMNRAGEWRTPIEFDEPGGYRVFADFVDGQGRTHTLSDNVDVGDGKNKQPLPEPSTSASDGGFDVELRERAGAHGTHFDFAVSRDGKPVRPGPYLGARGHLVVLRASDLAYLHVHPDEDRLSFDAELPGWGTYRLFLQFRAGGAVRTVAFTRRFR